MYYTSKFICFARTIEYFKIPKNVLVIAWENQRTQDVELL